ncbi:RNA methyltransferase [Halomicrobium sp. IBSBa]|uniref:RNA methyltransferase n=1 Tax=unclassified Halomicrobium TaxID=2610901 RepID=UPI001ABEEBBD|nr:RNA methyltransferase [Halomicrobium sp. IBSBa]MBO4246583.1 RNA methyltransferase [Halomicrobium sp. IBSBa]
MSSVAVAVVDAETPGNVGTIARSMKNFGLDELLLVDPPDLPRESEAYGYAGQAREDILPEAREISFDELVSEYHTVGCTAITNEDGSKHVRYPFVTPRDLADDLAGLDADTAIVFGRERVGLTNDEIERLDQVCSIPASEEYPVLNLGQAATIVLYELRSLTVEDTQLPDPTHDRAAQPEIEGLHEQFAGFLDAIDHPEEKRAKTRRLFQRLIGRAHPTGRETTTLRGLFRQASQRLSDEE